MFLRSLIEELFTKEENDKTSCTFNFGHECIMKVFDYFSLIQLLSKYPVQIWNLCLLKKRHNIMEHFMANLISSIISWQSY